MQTHSNTEESTLHELIVSLQPYLERLARKYSRDSYRVEYEELLSIGTLRACEAYSQAKTNPAAYMMKCAEYAMIDEVNKILGRRAVTVSLDAPLSEDGDTSLADVLAAPVSAAPVTSERVRAVHGALKRVPDRQRQVLMLTYGFEGYGSHTGKEAGRKLGNADGTVSGQAHRGRQKLLRDVKLCEVVGVAQ
jgi:RNA polymerase sigma factor (sigma-70 family)